MRYYPGATANPLRSYRNKICMCGSGKKLKRCHGFHVFIDPDDLDLYRAYEEFLIGNMNAHEWNHFAASWGKNKEVEGVSKD